MDQRLFSPDLLLGCDVAGVHGAGPAMLDLVDRIQLVVAAAAADEPARRMQFPPVMSRRDFERSGYFRSFGHLAGIVGCFCGDEEAHRAAVRRHDAGDDWADSMVASDLVLVPSACYPVYPALARLGPIPDPGIVVEVTGWCFRREHAPDQPARLQTFRQHERVYLGSEAGAAAFREAWIGRARTIAASLGLEADVAVANDPFFGRMGTIMAESQRAQALKLELTVPIGGRAVACASFNLHLTKMSQAWALRDARGEPVFTSCVGFGLERLAIAVLDRNARA